MTVTEQLEARHATASPKRFTAEQPTGFGDLFVARVDEASNTRFVDSDRLAWIEKPQRISVRVGYIHPDDETVVNWTDCVMTRDAAAKALRTARRNELRIEESVRGWEISGETGWHLMRGPWADAPVGGRL